MNPSTIARIEQLFPLLAEKARELITQLAAQGIDVEVSQGLRTWPEQAALYAQGRTTPGKIVTNATPAKSWHTFGCAFDIDVVDGSGVIDWSGTSPSWINAIAAGEHLGLTAGAEFRTFPDKPHFQLTGRFPVTPDDEVLILFKSGGLQAVWDEVSKSL
jgi:peptidoglycan L-alanyl-D-glutamate endopeptidase CwlK